ncbi:uncharacterized protein METZ01_LOCUS500734, partial [marine metagenome]
VRIFRRRTRWLELLASGLILVGLGIAHFSRITPKERQEIHLEADLAVLHYMQQDHLAKHGRYFDLADPKYGDYLPGLRNLRTKSRLDGKKGFSVTVYADFDGDGKLGTWRIDATAPEAVRISED